MDLTFQVLMQHCFLHRQTLLHHQIYPQVSAVPILTQLLRSGAVCNCPPLFPSSILDTFLPGGGSSGVISFCLFITSIRFSRQEYWSGLPTPPPVGHLLSELFSMAHLSWVALHDMAHSFSELCKPLPHNKAVIHERVHCLSSCEFISYDAFSM